MSVEPARDHSANGPPQQHAISGGASEDRARIEALAGRHIRVIAADDHPVVLTAIAEVMNAIPGFEVIATARRGVELLEVLSKQSCDLIISDLLMHKDDVAGDGLRLVRRVLDTYSETPLIAFTMLVNGGVIQQLCRMGVSGIVAKNEPAVVLGDVCIEVLTESEVPGRVALSPDLRARLSSEGVSTDDLGRHRQLSSREHDVIRLFASGLSMSEIAASMALSRSTVGTQKRAAMRKLHVSTNGDLLWVASVNGLLD